MKKAISMILVLATIFTLVGSVALAASNPFGSKTIRCAANTERFLNNYGGDNDRIKAKKLYVRHYLYGDFGGVHTNYFKASQNYGAGPLFGGNWMAPNTANYVTSNSLNLNFGAYAWGRGNTNYGLNSIVITGYSDPKG